MRIAGLGEQSGKKEKVEIRIRLRYGYGVTGGNWAEDSC